jgi:type IV pilus assembly protein PilM
MFAKERNLIGVDLGSNSIKLVELKRSRNEYTLKSIAIQELPEDAMVEGRVLDFTAVVDALTEIFEKSRCSHKNVITALKGYGVIAKRMDMNLEDIKNFNETFRWEANQYIDFDPNTMNIDYQSLEPMADTGKVPVIMAVAKKDIISDTKFVFDTAKLNLVAIDLEIFALVNLFEYNYPEVLELSSIIDVGHERIHMVFVENCQYKFSFDIDMGAKNCIELLKQMYDMNYEEVLNLLKNKEKLDGDVQSQGLIDQFYGRLGQSINNILRSVQKESGVEINNFYLCGGGIYLPGIKEYLDSALNRSTIFFNPFERIEVDSGLDEELMENNLYRFNISTGLALRKQSDAK